MGGPGLPPAPLLPTPLANIFANYLSSVVFILGSHTVGVIEGQESYELLKVSSSELFSAINKIIKEGKITVDECKIPVEIFLGGDYKVLVIINFMPLLTYRANLQITLMGQICFLLFLK